MEGAGGGLGSLRRRFEEAPPPPLYLVRKATNRRPSLFYSSYAVIIFVFLLCFELRMSFAEASVLDVFVNNTQVISNGEALDEFTYSVSSFPDVTKQPVLNLPVSTTPTLVEVLITTNLSTLFFFNPITSLRSLGQEVSGDNVQYATSFAPNTGYLPAFHAGSDLNNQTARVNLSLYCPIPGVFDTVYQVTLLSDSDAGTYTVQWDMRIQCEGQTCSCSELGECREGDLDSCVCQEGYNFDEYCMYGAVVEPAEVCPFETAHLHMLVSQQSPLTDFDWISCIRLDESEDTASMTLERAHTLISSSFDDVWWYYTASVYEIELDFFLLEPGSYLITYNYNDRYIPLSFTTIEVLPWIHSHCFGSVANYTLVDVDPLSNRLAQIEEACENGRWNGSIGQCVCDSGFTGPLCSSTAGGGIHEYSDWSGIVAPFANNFSVSRSLWSSSFNVRDLSFSYDIDSAGLPLSHFYYPDGTRTQYLIEPRFNGTAASSIRLSIDQIDLNSGDSLYIFEGNSTETEDLLYKWTASSSLLVDVIALNSSQATLVFDTASPNYGGIRYGNTPGLGFILSYSGMGCPKGSAIVNGDCLPCDQGSYSRGEDSISCRLCPQHSINYESGSLTCWWCPSGTYTMEAGALECLACSDIPEGSDRPHKCSDRFIMSSLGVALVLIASFIVCAWTVFTFFIFVRNRKSKVVYSKSFGLQITSLVGAFFLSIGASLGALPKSHDVCLIRYALVPSSHTLTIVPLLLQAQRMYRVFHSNKLIMTRVHTSTLVAVSGFVFAVEFAIQYVYYYLNDAGLISRYERGCDVSEHKSMAIATTLYHMFLVWCTVYVERANKTIPIDFKEKFKRNAYISLFFVVLVNVTTHIVLTNLQHNVYELMFSIFVALITAIHLANFFLEKTLRLISDEKSGVASQRRKTAVLMNVSLNPTDGHADPQHQLGVKARKLLSDISNLDAEVIGIRDEIQRSVQQINFYYILREWKFQCGSALHTSARILPESHQQIAMASNASVSGDGEHSRSDLIGMTDDKGLGTFSPAIPGVASNLTRKRTPPPEHVGLEDALYASLEQRPPETRVEEASLE